MLRLRTTTGLSLLALAMGVGGTAWLSEQTVGWEGPARHVQTAMLASAPVKHHSAKALPHHARQVPERTAWRAIAYAQSRPVMVPSVVDAQAEVLPPPELVPIAMPSTSVPYEAMRHHLDGRVLLHLTLDGRGYVTDATLAASSGDPTLDAHALDTVRQWRFAVPADRPDGFSGDLRMRFTVGDQQLAQLR